MDYTPEMLAMIEMVRVNAEYLAQTDEGWAGVVEIWSDDEIMRVVGDTTDEQVALNRMNDAIDDFAAEIASM